ncbi:hypothetical protein BDZ89DRAFT_1044064 [Hymenopellis radicata]|nr:hypothetical protein BDZ89DRAFT_1044064 [Hymenopellis radicata]
MIAAKKLTSLKLDSNCSCGQLSDFASRIVTARALASHLIAPHVTDLTIYLTENASRRDLFGILRHLYQNTLWSIQRVCFDTGLEPSASLASLIEIIAPIVRVVKLTLNNCSSTNELFSKFHLLTALVQLSLAVNETMISDLAEALLSLPRPHELASLRLEITLDRQLHRDGWTQLGSCIASRGWVAVMGLQSVLISMPTPESFVRWQREAFTVRRLINGSMSSDNVQLEVQPMMSLRSREPYYPPGLPEHNESSIQRTSNMIEQSHLMPNDVGEADFPIIAGELPSFLLWYMSEGRFED